MRNWNWSRTAPPRLCESSSGAGDVFSLAAVFALPVPGAQVAAGAVALRWAVSGFNTSGVFSGEIVNRENAFASSRQLDERKE
jgi:hypothetical protein